jgi:pimeloyl-ACP methyl ester carboxylesterase
VSTGGAIVKPLASVAGACLPKKVTELGVGHRAIGIANGMFGERAAVRGGELPAVMTVRQHHRRVDLDRAALAAAFPSASGRIVVFLHGLVETERSWFHQSEPAKERTGTDFGGRLAEDYASSAIYLRYNTGRHVSDNGRELVGLLSALVEHWPTKVTEIVLIGHSMGGLVARSALHQAQAQATPWISRVTRLVCLGTPHTGAPLERGVAAAATLLGGFLTAAPFLGLLALRSDGIKDLAKGHLHQEQWLDNDGATPHDVTTVLPAGVRQYFVAVTLSRTEGSLWGRLFGDLLVAPASAADRTQAADFRWFGGMNHFDLLRHDAVYDAMLTWLRSTGDRIVGGARPHAQVTTTVS